MLRIKTNKCRKNAKQKAEKQMCCRNGIILCNMRAIKSKRDFLLHNFYAQLKILSSSFYSSRNNVLQGETLQTFYVSLWILSRFSHVFVTLHIHTTLAVETNPFGMPRRDEELLLVTLYEWKAFCYLQEFCFLIVRSLFSNLLGEVLN